MNIISPFTPMKKSLVLLLSSFFFFFGASLFSADTSAGFSGSTTQSITAGSIASPTYYVASAGLSGDVVYSGIVDAVWDANNSVYFSSEQNSSLDYNPPFKDSAFDKDILLPRVTATLSGDAVGSITVDYLGAYGTSVNGFNGSDTRFVEAPEIIIDAPDGSGSGDDVTATATATISSGELSIAVASGGGGDGYTAAPKVTVVGGPHFLKITDVDSAYYGRVFLIQDNTSNTLSFGTLTDTQRLSSSESSTGLATFIPVGTTVEIYAAHTLGSLFGLGLSDLPTNWTSGVNADDDSSGSGPDMLYFWNIDFFGFETYFYSTKYRPSSYSGSGDTHSWGWKKPSRAFYPKTANNKVIYPDESFLIAKRSTGNLELTSEGLIETTNKQLYLPETGNSAILNNPYGTELMLAELIPSTAIGTGTGQFRPGTDDSTGDVVTFLEGVQWKRFWYDSSHGNTAVSSMHVIGTRRPLESGANAATMDADDFYIGSGAVTGLDSCDASGNTGGITGNDSNYTKVTIGSGIDDLEGFSITFSDVNGRLLDGDSNGTLEANATSGGGELSVGTGSLVFSKVIGTHEIVSSGSGYVVLNLQRDVNFLSSEGTPVWSIGTTGGNYSTTANFYCIGGTTGTNAKGTISSNGSTITVSTNGSSYTGKPSVIVSGGGWRYAANNGSRDDDTLGASSGLFVERQAASGVKSFIESTNPFE